MSQTWSENGERACPVCGSWDSILFADEKIDQRKMSALTYSSRKTPEFMRLRLVRCANCDLVYAPVPTAEDILHAAYAEADFDSASDAIAAARTYAGVLQPFVEKLPKRNAAVDVGTGSGPLLPWLKLFGFSPVIGIEPSHAACLAAPPEVQAMLREGMFSPELLLGITSSLICSFMTLEHMAKPAEFAATAYHLLEPGGGFAVVVHDWQAPLNRLLGLRSPIIDIEHLQLFSSVPLRLMLSNAGFHSISIQSIRNAYPLRYWVRLAPLNKEMKRVLTYLLESLNIADRFIALNVGNLMATAIK